MRSRLPARIAAYLAGLPGGLDAFPECCVLASVVQVWLAGHDMAPLLDILPAPLGRLVRGEHPPDAWVPEVHANVAYLALRVLHFPSDDAFVRDAHARNAELLANNPTGMSVGRLSPANIEERSRSLFHSMHRGITVEVDTAPQPWIWRLRFPDRLVPELLARCYATALAAGLELAGKQAVYVELVEHHADHIDVAVLFEH